MRQHPLAETGGWQFGQSAGGCFLAKVIDVLLFDHLTPKIWNSYVLAPPDRRPCEIVAREPMRQLTHVSFSLKIVETIANSWGAVQVASLCGLSSGACAVLRRLHNPRTCAMEATPPAWKCASATAFISSIAALAFACWASSCKVNSARSPSLRTSSFRTFIGTTFRACHSFVRCMRMPTTDFCFSARLEPAVSSKCCFYEIEDGCVTLEDGIQLQTAWLNHPQGCMGFRLETKDGIFVYATDNEPGDAAFDKAVRKLAEGADVLIYDAQYLPEEYEARRHGWGHSHWREAVNVVMESGAKELVLFHHDPHHDDTCIDRVVKQARNYYPLVRAAAEGMEIKL